ncbi:hypothetical protein KAT36_00920 [Candidatus Pacearchaeota archaeon]|nr:hypothetical protein [Candidatus Pacearchaeota archaeon]
MICENKVGAVNWTIGKLLNVVLLVIVLVLIIYGITTGGLKPLIDSLEVKFDEVQILLGFKEALYSGCYKTKIVDLGGGEEFLVSLGIVGRDAVLEICRDGVCSINESEIGAYRIVKGVVEKFDDGEWSVCGLVFGDRLSSVKFNWEMYHKGVDVLENAGVKDLYNRGFTRQFILYGDGDVYAIWQNGYWRVTGGGKISNAENWVKEGENWVLKDWCGKIIKKVKNYYSGTDDDEAIDVFAEEVRRGYDDKVYWQETIPTKPDVEYISGFGHGEIIGTLVGDIGWFFDKLDDDEEVEKLKLEFKKRKKMYLNEARLSDDDVKRLGDAIKGKKINVTGKEFEVGAEGTREFPIVSFSGDEKFGLRHSFNAKMNSDFIPGVKLRYFPVNLVKWGESAWSDVGNEEYYRLYERNFKEVYEATLISQFLREKCK